jgi:hypothetical protein
MKRQLVLGDLTATVADEARLAWLALITGRVVDDLATAALGLPNPGPVEVVARLRGVDPTAPGESGRFTITTKPGGLFAVSAARDRALADLSTATRIIDLTIGAPGFLSVTRSVTIPAGSTAFPFTVPDVRLRRPAVRIRGRLMSVGPGSIPLPGRTVAVTAPVGLAGFRTATAWAHPSSTTITPVAVTLVGPDLGLRDDVWPGDTVVALDRRTGLSAGSIVHLGTGIDDDELVIVSSLGAPATLDDPGSAVLATPAARVHHAGTPTQQATVAPSGPAAVTTTDIDAAALIAIVDHPERLPDGQACQVDDADPTRVELRTAHAPSAITDAGGYYSTGPVGAARTARVQVTPSTPQVTVTYTLRFDQPDNVLNLNA